MNLEDLGDLGGPMLIFGGPYSNLQAVEALRARASRLGIGAGNVICTGDVVAYCGDPAATVAAIRDWGCHVVAGNCERQLAAGAMDCGCGFEAGSTCDLLSAGWFAHASAAIDAPARRWMAELPDMITFGHGGLRHAVIHGGLHDVSRFLWPVSPEAELAEEIARITAAAGTVDRVFAGHCGLAFLRRVGGVEWVNAGVIGMPANDGRPETDFAYLDAEVSLHRLSYDHAGARRAMIDAGLSHGYHDALTRGYWPSEGVLPAALRRGSA